ncbi:hypothetical protein VNO77_02029 [Canavalia gladiata]|uniref:Uncharacterized protein n=1 Tax=Canavalia gladiata TaxID=3824 RepID=A0AAN9MSW1_CANGL
MSHSLRLSICLKPSLSLFWLVSKWHHILHETRDQFRTQVYPSTASWASHEARSTEVQGGESRAKYSNVLEAYSWQILGELKQVLCSPRLPVLDPKYPLNRIECSPLCDALKVHQTLARAHLSVEETFKDDHCHLFVHFMDESPMAHSATQVSLLKPSSIVDKRGGKSINSYVKELTGEVFFPCGRLSKPHHITTNAIFGCGRVLERMCWLARRGAPKAWGIRASHVTFSFEIPTISNWALCGIGSTVCLDHLLHSLLGSSMTKWAGCGIGSTALGPRSSSVSQAPQFAWIICDQMGWLWNWLYSSRPALHSLLGSSVTKWAGCGIGSTALGPRSSSVSQAPWPHSLLDG